jgi:hypothetical protein
MSNENWQKSMCLAAALVVAVAGCQTLACALEIMVLCREPLHITGGGMVCCRLRRGWICFCTVPIDERKASRHDEIVKMDQSR